MIRLGHIPYSNCWPIHEPLLRSEADRSWLAVTEGSPAALNSLLSRGELDVAPCSSIELARHDGEYRVLQGLCIASRGPVESIALVTRLPLAALGGARVALPTASATSRVLLRILLARREGVEPRWEEFEQEREDPLTRDEAAAALFIGDVAMRRRAGPAERRVDLGEEWTRWTGLPFVYALWQARGEALDGPDLREVHGRMLAARDALPSGCDALAAASARRFGFAPERLAAYWRRIRYSLDEEALAGLRRFYALAAELREVPVVPEVPLWE